MSDEKISPCKICGRQPFILKTNITANGCTFMGYYVECVQDDEQQLTPPFVEHSLTVYGATRSQAIERWEQIAK